MFIWIVETNILVNKCKECNPVEIIYLAIPVRERNNIGLSNERTKWLCSMVEFQDTLQSANCHAVVDESFFLEKPEIILSY